MEKRLAILGLAILSVVAAPSARAQLTVAVERTRAHDDRGALDALARLSADDRSAIGAGVLEATLLERVGRLREARDRWRGLDLGQLPRALRPAARLRLARLEARTGLFAEARVRARTLIEDGGDPSLAASGRALAAECALALGDSATAATEFEALLASDDASIDRTTLGRELARALLGLARRDDAATRLREAYFRAPAHPDAALVLDELAAIDPARAARTVDERLGLATVLTAARAFDRALSELDGARPTTDDQRAALAHARGTVLFAKRDYRESITAFDEAVRRRATTAADDAYSAARAANRLGDDGDAKSRFEAFLAANPEDRRLDELRLTLATIALDHGDLAPIERLARRDGSARAIRAEAAFALALARLATGDRGAAGDALALACPHLRDDSERLACRYFGAVTAVDATVARTAFERLATEQTHTFYGLAARHRLADDHHPFRAEPLPRVAITAVAGPMPEEVSFLASLGLDEDAADRLATHERDDAYVGAEGRMRLVSIYAGLRDYGRSFRVARTLATTAGVPRAWADSAQHPEPFADEVVPLASSVGLDPFYVYATMRQESGFRADAVSRVGALGILQMMPATAARAALRANLGEAEATSLFDARTSVRLAIVEMRELDAHYRGCLPLVVAAYNAGTAKVDAWVEARRSWPIDLFLQAIPFDETRGYVRRVLGHTARYHALAGRPERGPELFDTCRAVTAGIH